MARLLDKSIASVVVAGLLLVAVFMAVYEETGLLSSDERDYICAMSGACFERHPGFWVPASLFYRALGSLGARLYNLALYFAAVIVLVYWSRRATSSLLRVLVVSSFALNPFVVYFSSRILGEASGYVFLTLSLLLAEKSGFLSGLAFGAGFTGKYYLAVSAPLVFSALYRSRSGLKSLALFIIGAAIPVAGMLAYSYAATGDAFYVLTRAGPELYKPLAERHYILSSFLLSSTSIFIVSFPFTRDFILSLLGAWRKSRLLVAGFALMFLANMVLGFLHMSGMEGGWRYKDHLRLASVVTPVFPYFIALFAEEKLSARYVAALVALSIATVFALLLLRLREYGVLF